MRSFLPIILQLSEDKGLLQPDREPLRLGCAATRVLEDVLHERRQSPGQLTTMMPVARYRVPPAVKQLAAQSMQDRRNTELHVPPLAVNIHRRPAAPRFMFCKAILRLNHKARCLLFLVVSLTLASLGLASATKTTTLLQAADSFSGMIESSP